MCSSCLIFFKEPISSQVILGTVTNPSLLDEGTTFFKASLKSSSSIRVSLTASNGIMQSERSKFNESLILLLVLDNKSSISLKLSTSIICNFFFMPSIVLLKQIVTRLIVNLIIFFL